MLTYDSEQYELAKEFCFRQFTNVDAHQYQVGDYHFVEHLCQTSKNEAGKYEISCEYPEIFNMFAYNDALCTLLFLGYYEPNEAGETLLALTDFEAFYDLHFSRYYPLTD